ncbi:MAG: hypothetical protein RLZZ352_2181 [Pseudomonadota bacterium]|jgi:hypothetical protein
MIDFENESRESLINLIINLQVENELLKARSLKLENQLKQCREFAELSSHYAMRGMDQVKKLAQFKQDRRKGADAIHTENRELKAEVFKWLDENFTNYKSMDAAAEAMTGKGKLVPLTFRTVRGWVTEWKKLRYASTP